MRYKNKPIIIIYYNSSQIHTRKHHTTPQYMPGKTHEISHRLFCFQIPGPHGRAPRIQRDDPRLLMRPPGRVSEETVNFNRKPEIIMEHPRKIHKTFEMLKIR